MRTPVSSADEVAVRLVARGDAVAYQALYERYGPAVRGLARRMVGVTDADDVLQEVFSSLWLNAGQYDPTRGQFRSWLMTIARNQCIQLIRRRGRLAQVGASEAIERLVLARADSQPGPEARAAVREQSAELLEALRALPEDQRRVILLGYFGGLSQAEIAAVTGWPLGTVKRRVQLAMQKLRRRYGADAASQATSPVAGGAG